MHFLDLLGIVLLRMMTPNCVFYVNYEHVMRLLEEKDNLK